MNASGLLKRARASRWLTRPACGWLAWMSSPLTKGLVPTSRRSWNGLRRPDRSIGEAMVISAETRPARSTQQPVSCKSVSLGLMAKSKLMGHIGGEIIGIDGIGSNVHECEATALEDMEVCRLPFERIENFARFSDQFRHNLYMLLSQESSRVQALTHILGSMRAEKRLAIFLLDLSHRYKARGFSSCEFVLRMTREEIGSYLGLKLETVSRLFSRFQNDRRASGAGPAGEVAGSGRSEPARR